MKFEQVQFLRDCAISAMRASHVFPRMAACEAALESGYGRSTLAIVDKNLFGMKAHVHPTYGTHVLPTKEFVGPDRDADGNRDGWTVVKAAWVSYPSLDACFADRMSTLQRLASVYPHYAAALDAQDPETYINEVSKTWSTDPLRAAKVMSIYRQMDGMWDAQTLVAT